MKSFWKKSTFWIFSSLSVIFVVLFLSLTREHTDSTKTEQKVAVKGRKTPKKESKPKEATTQSVSVEKTNDKIPEELPSTEASPESGMSSENNGNCENQSQVYCSQRNVICINGVEIPFVNAGLGTAQSVIDANPYGVAATWGGAAVFSANDHLNTHFIGHTPGIFSVLFTLTIGSQLSIVDMEGIQSYYQVEERVIVNDQGFVTSSGADYWDKITGVGGGERVTFQTCVNESENLIIFANRIY